MKKLLASILILSLVLGSYREAKAVLPLLPAAATAAATAITLVGGVYYYLQPGYSPSVSRLSTITRNAAAAYYVIDSINKVSNVVVKDLTATKDVNQLIDTVKKDSNSYPNLASAISQSQDFTQVKKGDIISVDSNKYEIGELKSSSTATVYSFSPSGVFVYSGYITFQTVSFSHEVGTTKYYTRVIQQFYYTPVSNVDDSDIPINPTTLAELISNSDGSPKSQALQDELDKMMKNPPYVPVFSDDTTGLPWAPPADVVSPAVANEYDKRREAAAAAAAAVSAANSAVAAAQAAHDSAVADAAANPDDPSLQDKAAQTLIQLTNAQAAAAGAAANAAAVDATQAAVEADAIDLPAPVEPPPGLKSFNWGAATKLLGTLETAWPFNLLMSLRGLFAPLEAPPTAPSFDMHIYGDNKVHIDLSFFDPVATICRWAVSLLLTSLGIMAIVRWYRG